ncbi:hypothetical protein Q4503_05390, partial [Colwellia sp. 6_MG-2023]|uniref:hypothetical protein n=1 Tax=Colwellia sp. 6_MG-2023 TaxID=3062676 RepID=UPI0026E392D7
KITVLTRLKFNHFSNIHNMSADNLNFLDLIDIRVTQKKLKRLPIIACCYYGWPNYAIGGNGESLDPK